MLAYLLELSILALSILTVAGRIYARIRILRAIGVDDWFIIAATGGFILQTTLHLVMTRFGAGRHMTDIPASTYPPRFILAGVVRLLYIPTSALVRISVLLFMRRLSPHRIIQYAAFILITLTSVTAVSLLVLLVFQCSPPSIFFIPVPLRPPHECLIQEQHLSFVVPLASVILDFLVWIVPLVMIVRLQFVDWKKKLVLIILLGLGLLACIASFMRLEMVYHINSDQSWQGAKMCIWNCVELGIAITAASIPSLAPLIGIFSAHIRTKYRGVGNNNDEEQHLSRSEPLRSPRVQEVGLEDLHYDNRIRESGLDSPRRMPNYKSTEALFNEAKMGRRRADSVIPENV
ncbi:Similar to integral membrane protein [Aspergillus kawachii IFO 4308]; acc. no. GAA89824 [Pyronema omphalodes CBS 100304]|uniref:Similar to integral membrane protein [Aspergillus kawachii IFO 4308] acc. no. GAA89824 n=1 Tax=Pyronema omphalodes (strain CBS 100304) TaxID=1076935 RepID=U4L919_PYROM|nr:Similar to integral membrane protein [Aspergillus kawachii IFO 4308]; acc. no. GAA89824 [Pyronema omphalodes CBS 100304]